jgi:hypothetical protein
MGSRRKNLRSADDIGDDRDHVQLQWRHKRKRHGDLAVRVRASAFQNMSRAENNGFGILSDGFTGLGNLASGEDLNFAFDVTLTTASAVAEPSASLPICAAAIILYFLSRRRR